MGKKGVAATLCSSLVIGFLAFNLFFFFPIISRADPLDNWQWRNPLPQGNTLNGAAYGNGTFVAVGDLGTIVTSVDGAAWTVDDLRDLCL